MSVNTRKFVEDLLYLGSIGGYLDKTCPAIKGLMMRAEVLVPEDVAVELSPSIKLSTKSLVRAGKVRRGEIPVNNEDGGVGDEENASTGQTDASVGGSGGDEDKPAERLTEDQINAMTLAEIREMTGILGKTKKETIKEYLSQ